MIIENLKPVYEMNIQLLFTIFVHIVSVYTFIKDLTIWLYFSNSIKQYSLSNDTFLYEYSTLFNNKIYTLVFNEKDHLENFIILTNDAFVKGTFDIFFQNRNKITHCCIATFDKDGEIDQYILDITEYIKCFVYYFHKDTPDIKWECIFLYINEMTHKNIFDDSDATAQEIFIYISLDNFTELKFNVKNLYTQSFPKLI
jgi:hypothetical protein